MRRYKSETLESLDFRAAVLTVQSKRLDIKLACLSRALDRIGEALDAFRHEYYADDEVRLIADTFDKLVAREKEMKKDSEAFHQALSDTDELLTAMLKATPNSYAQ